MTSNVGYSIKGAIGLVITSSYVVFGDGSYAPVVVQKSGDSTLTWTIRGAGYTGTHKFEIPVITYIYN